MAGNCAGCGITTDGNDVAVRGPVQATTGEEGDPSLWPYGLGAPIGTYNGIRCDPNLESIWTDPPATYFTASDTGSELTIHPTNDSQHFLTELVLQHTATVKGNTMVRFDIAGGFAGMRMASGNWWSIARYITTYVNTVPTTFSDSEVVASLENNSGGILGAGGVVDAQHGWLLVPASAVVKVVAHYVWNFISFDDDAANGLSWRPPRLTMMMWNVPQQ